MLLRHIRPGGHLDDDMAKLFEGWVRQLDNGRVGYPIEQAVHYRQVVGSIHAHLRQRIRPGDIVALTDVPCHEALMRDDVGSIEQVAIAMDELTYRLRTTAEEIRFEIRKWEFAGHALVPDTNVLLHHLTNGSIEATDWRELAGFPARRDCVIIVLLVVLDELDRLKRNGPNETRSSAREAIRQLHRLIGDAPTSIRPLDPDDLSLKIVVQVPGLEHKPLPKPDNEIIDRDCCTNR